MCQIKQLYFTASYSHHYLLIMILKKSVAEINKKPERASAT